MVQINNNFNPLSEALAQIEMEILFIFFLFKKIKRLQWIAGIAPKKYAEMSSV
jgi:hypothetical protein